MRYLLTPSGIRLRVRRPRPALTLEQAAAIARQDARHAARAARATSPARALSAPLQALPEVGGDPMPSA